MPGPVRNPNDAYQQLEAVMLRQMLHASGAFNAGGLGGTSPGAQLRADMFVETLADAVAKAGGLGIARMLEQQLGGGASPGSASASGASGASPAFGGPSAIDLHALRSPHSLLSRFTGGAALGPAGGLTSAGFPARGSAGVGAIDDLDDPNSEAPLPEDPTAASIDDYQPAPPSVAHPHLHGAAPAGPGLAPLSAAPGSHLHPDLPSPIPLRRGVSGLLPNSAARALNRYRERDESTGGGTTFGPSVGEKP